MANTKRRFFTEEYKRQTVDLVRSSGRSIGSVATEIGLSNSVLRKWVNEVRRLGATGGSDTAPNVEAALPTADQASEIAKFKRENDRLRMERDILKKSIAIFAGTRT